MLTRYLKTIFAAALLATAAFQPATAAFPERPVTIVVPFSAGGNTDVIARIFADHLSEALGSPVVVENRGGGGGTVGAALVAAAEADGYTLLFGTAGSHSVNPNLRDVKYDPIKDFTPISVGVNSSVLIVTNPSVGANTLQDLIRLTSATDAQFNYASGGVGTVAHVAGEIYNEKTGSKMNHVPYKGAGQALNDVIAGRVQVYMNNLPTFLAHVRSGELTAVALASPERSSLLPDVPTTSEAGLEGLEMGSWYGLLGPKGVPQEAVDRLHAAMASAKDSAKVRERLEAIGCEVAVSRSPAEFGSFMEQQLGWWAKTLDNPVFKN